MTNKQHILVNFDKNARYTFKCLAIEEKHGGQWIRLVQRNPTNQMLSDVGLVSQPSRAAL